MLNIRFKVYRIVMRQEKTRRQYLIRGGAALGGAAVLAGCASQGNTQQSESETSESSDTDESNDSSESSETTISWWHAMGGQRGQVLEEMVEDFNNQSDSVTVDPVFKGSYTETVNAAITAVRAGEAPALVQALNPTSQMVRDSGQFEPMESFVGDQVDWSRFHDAVLNYYRWDDTVQALPFNTSNPVLYYNKDAFRDAGLDPNDPPTSLAGVREAAQALVDEGATETGLTFKNTSWYVEQWFATQNQTLVNKENGRAGDADEIHLTSDAASTIYNWIVDMHADDLFIISGGGAGGGSNDTPIQVFVNGEAGMLIQTTGDAVSIGNSADENGFELGMGQFPAPDGTSTGLVVGGGGIWTTKGLSNPKQNAVAEFISWLSEAEQQAFWHSNTGYFPTTKDATAVLQDDGWFEENPGLEIAFDQLEQTEDTPATRGFQAGPALELRSLMQDGLVSMVTGSDVEETLSQRKTEGDRILQDYIESKG